jgi:hypothetical protein
MSHAYRRSETCEISRNYIGQVGVDGLTSMIPNPQANAIAPASEIAFCVSNRERKRDTFRSTLLQKTASAQYNVAILQRIFNPAEEVCIYESDTLSSYEPIVDPLASSRQKPSPRGILRQLDSIQNIHEMAVQLSELEQWLQRTELREMVADEIRHPELCLKSLSRATLLESLCNVSAPMVGLLAIESLTAGASSDYDEFSLSCCITLRRVASSSVDGASAISALLNVLKTDKLGVRNPSPLVREVIRQAILALGTFGELDQLMLLLNSLVSDRSFNYGHQLADALARILSRSPLQHTQEIDRRIQDVCIERLEVWLHPLVSVNFDMFSRASSMLSILFARLDTEDTELACSLIEKSKNRHMAITAQGYLAHFRESLEFRGFGSHLEANHFAIEDVRKRLSLIANSTEEV